MSDDDRIKSAAEIALENAGTEEIDDLPETEEATLVPDPEEESFKDKYLRTRADLDNIQRRMREERESMRVNAMVGFLRDLLPVVDNLDRALAAAGDDDSDLAQGLRMTRQSLDAVFEQNKISRIPTDTGFNPDRHEAITSIEDAGVPVNTIKLVIEEGYTLAERVVRYSKVQVTTGGPETPFEKDA